MQSRTMQFDAVREHQPTAKQSSAGYRAMIAILAAASLTGLGCRQASEAKHVTIVISGDTAGWITPCGCAANQSGGLARRATLIDRLRADGDVIVWDVGGSAIGAGEYQTLKFSSLLDGMQQMNLALHNVGESETQFTPDELRKLGDASSVTWISANLTDAQGSRVGVALSQVEHQGIRIAVTGIVDPKRVRNSQWVAREGVQAVLGALDGCTADVKIVLAYYDEAGLRRLAQQLPEVDYIIGGPTGQSISPQREGPVTILSVTKKGKFLATIELTKDSSSQRIDDAVKIVEVTSDLPESGPQIENLARYHERLKARDFTAREAALSRAAPTITLASQFKIAGSHSCAACHGQDNQLWHASKHAHAWDVLVMKDSQFDPECQQCHTTGYGIDGGFVNVNESGNRTGVGCENCHGPSLAHVRDPRVRTPFPAKEQCLGCHDHENSPAFALTSYWQKIVHGKTPATKSNDSDSTQGKL